MVCEEACSVVFGPMNGTEIPERSKAYKIDSTTTSNLLGFLPYGFSKMLGADLISPLVSRWAQSPLPSAINGSVLI